jgi:hypothetical protein
MSGGRQLPWVSSQSSHCNVRPNEAPLWRVLHPWRSEERDFYWPGKTRGRCSASVGRISLERCRVPILGVATHFYSSHRRCLTYAVAMAAFLFLRAANPASSLSGRKKKSPIRPPVSATAPQITKPFMYPSAAEVCPATALYDPCLYSWQIFVKARHPYLVQCDLRHLGSKFSFAGGKQLHIGGAKGRLIRKWVVKGENSAPGHFSLHRSYRHSPQELPTLVMASHQMHRETMLIRQNWKKYSCSVLLPIVRQSRDSGVCRDKLLTNRLPSDVASTITKKH